MNKRPNVGVGVIVKKEDKILLLKRTNSHGQGTWSFPGGHLEFGEEIAACVRREVHEETTLQVTDIEFVGLTNDVFKEENKHYITIFMRCRYKSGQAVINEPDKCTEIGWFNTDTLPTPLFLPIQNLLKQDVTL